MNSYQDLAIYRDAFQLAIEVHFMSMKMPKHELHELGSQVRRSAQSVRSNIVEGYGRRKYKSDFTKFLTYADASLQETKSHIEMITALYHIEDCQGLLIRYNQLGKQLNNFILYVEGHWKSGTKPG